jgi:hypothetical protein
MLLVKSMFGTQSKNVVIHVFVAIALSLPKVETREFLSVPGHKSRFGQITGHAIVKSFSADPGCKI